TGSRPGAPGRQRGGADGRRTREGGGERADGDAGRGTDADARGRTAKEPAEGRSGERHAKRGEAATESGH
ncbi:quercetin 2,3-dioxygenase, partial [Mycobacterium tuberculosis]